MTTEIRARQSSQRVASQAANFHAPAALDSYGRHFSRIGIASVAAAAAQVRAETDGTPAGQTAKDIPFMLRWDNDAA